MKKKIARLLAFAMAFALTACGAPAAPTEPPPTEEPPVVAVGYAQVLDTNAEPIRSMVSGSLYRLSAGGGEILPHLAAALPEDVTAEYAGNEIYGVDAGAVRGYAFRVDLNESACWEDAAPITADAYLQRLILLLGNEAYAPEFAAIANASEYLSGQLRQTGEITTLADRGISGIAEAREMGMTEFYLDVGTFWGVDGQWLPIDDTTRLRDYAMPTGLDEMYISAAYLYNAYLADGAEYDYLQSEYIGIPAESSPVTLEDVGILKSGEHQLTFVFETPTTAEALALSLTALHPHSNAALSCGPYRVVSSDAAEIMLERSGAYWGGERDYPADMVCFRKAG